MKINQLRYFIAVVDYGSINKAAEKLYISQPSLSRSLQALEEEMGKKLVIRSNHGVSMTPTGRMLYYYGQSIVNELNVLERLKGLDEKTIYSKLSVSVDSIFLRDDMILHCYEKLVSDETEIQVMETTAEGVLDNVTSSKSEVGITILNNFQYPVFKKMAELRNLETFILGTGPVYVHINEHHPLAENNEINFSQLKESTYIHLPSDFFSNLNLSLNIDGVQLTHFPKTLIMSNYHAILNLLKHADSFYMGHKWQVDELRHSHIKSLLLKNCDLEKNFVIVKHKNDILSDAANIFLDIIQENYSHM